MLSDESGSLRASGEPFQEKRAYGSEVLLFPQALCGTVETVPLRKAGLRRRGAIEEAGGTRRGKSA